MGYKNEWYYDELGNSILTIRLVSYGISSYIDGSKTEREFYENGLSKAYANYKWDNSLGKWKGSSKWNIQYLDSTHINTFTRFDWDLGFDEWMPYGREVYFYYGTYFWV